MTDVEILKKAGGYDIEKMRTIMLMNSEFNMNNKKLGRWEYIMAPILKAALPRMGYVRSFPPDVVYAPESLCGLGVFHPWHNQHLSQLKVVLQ